MPELRDLLGSSARGPRRLVNASEVVRHARRRVLRRRALTGALATVLVVGVAATAMGRLQGEPSRVVLHPGPTDDRESEARPDPTPAASPALDDEDQLRRQLAMAERLGLTTTSASVTDVRPVTNILRSALLDIGAEDGVLPGMAVFNELGLVGQVRETTKHNARIELLTSPRARYGVRVEESGEIGYLTGRDPGPFRLELQEREAMVPPDAQVVTHLFTGTSIPDGIPIGVVAEQADQTSRFLDVTAHVDFTQLTTVQVVLDSPPSQSERDAARDGLPAELAALPFGQRVNIVGASDGQQQVETAEGVWVVSQLIGLGMEGQQILGDPRGRRGREFVHAGEYGELLLLDHSRTRIKRAFPFPGYPPQSLAVTEDAVYCSKGGDGGLPNSMLARVDRRSFERTVRVFPCDGVDCDGTAYGSEPRDWIINEPSGEERLGVLFVKSGGQLWGRSVSGSAARTRFDPETLEVVEFLPAG